MIRSDWQGLFQSIRQADVVPRGWSTAKEIAAALKYKGKQGPVIRGLRELKKNGAVEVRNFRVRLPSGRLAQVPHYKKRKP